MNISLIKRILSIVLCVAIIGMSIPSDALALRPASHKTSVADIVTQDNKTSSAGDTNLIFRRELLKDAAIIVPKIAITLTLLGCPEPVTQLLDIDDEPLLNLPKIELGPLANEDMGNHPDGSIWAASWRDYSNAPLDLSEYKRGYINLIATGTGKVLLQLKDSTSDTWDRKGLAPKEYAFELSAYSPGVISIPLRVFDVDLSRVTRIALHSGQRAWDVKLNFPMFGILLNSNIIISSQPLDSEDAYKDAPDASKSSSSGRAILNNILRYKSFFRNIRTRAALARTLMVLILAASAITPVATLLPGCGQAIPVIEPVYDIDTPASGLATYELRDDNEDLIFFDTDTLRADVNAKGFGNNDIVIEISRYYKDTDGAIYRYYSVNGITLASGVVIFDNIFGPGTESSGLPVGDYVYRIRYATKVGNKEEISLFVELENALQYNAPSAFTFSGELDSVKDTYLIFADSSRLLDELPKDENNETVKGESAVQVRITRVDGSISDYYFSYYDFKNNSFVAGIPNMGGAPLSAEVRFIYKTKMSPWKPIGGLGVLTPPADTTFANELDRTTLLIRADLDGLLALLPKDAGNNPITDESVIHIRFITAGGITVDQWFSYNDFNSNSGVAAIPNVSGAPQAINVRFENDSNVSGWVTVGSLGVLTPPSDTTFANELDRTTLLIRADLDGLLALLPKDAGNNPITDESVIHIRFITAGGITVDQWFSYNDFNSNSGVAAIPNVSGAPQAINVRFENDSNVSSWVTVGSLGVLTPPSDTTFTNELDGTTLLIRADLDGLLALLPKDSNNNPVKDQYVIRLRITRADGTISNHYFTYNNFKNNSGTANSGIVGIPNVTSMPGNVSMRFEHDLSVSDWLDIAGLYKLTSPENTTFIGELDETTYLVYADLTELESLLPKDDNGVIAKSERTIHLRLTDRDGNLRDIYWNFNEFKNAGGNILGVSNVETDPDRAQIRFEYALGASDWVDIGAITVLPELPEGIFRYDYEPGNAILFIYADPGLLQGYLDNASAPKDSTKVVQIRVGGTVQDVFWSWDEFVAYDFKLAVYGVSSLPPFIDLRIKNDREVSPWMELQTAATLQALDANSFSYEYVPEASQVLIRADMNVVNAYTEIPHTTKKVVQARVPGSYAFTFWSWEEFNSAQGNTLAINDIPADPGAIDIRVVMDAEVSPWFESQTAVVLAQPSSATFIGEYDADIGKYLINADMDLLTIDLTDQSVPADTTKVINLRIVKADGSVEDIYLSFSEFEDQPGNTLGVSDLNGAPLEVRVRFVNGTDVSDWTAPKSSSAGQVSVDPLMRQLVLPGQMSINQMEAQKHLLLIPTANPIAPRRQQSMKEISSAA